ncbi:P-loop NTPase fold protein [Taibaiella soli]|uniref:KAP NTPase domain-containing protein n=1 Tax=Taibaiella soli TaxID=1649169 RepID=A0A2W2AAV1_9BACT|nr:P-loop NTPase fold protein [Taibaiella soli]PZF72515.1 hypothetical protein DN068_11665 [Taibaiella soli]
MSSTTEEQLELELFKEPQNTFSKHLNIKGNERILFSAKFGMGKTTFLKHYFDLPENKKKYNVIHLFPVNYSVATNEDIFRYIKYDIILEMILAGMPVEDIELTLSDTLLYILPQHIDTLIITLITMLGLAGKDVSETAGVIPAIITAGKELKEKVERKHKEIESTNSDAKQLLEYVDTLSKREGSIFEYDLVTEIIAKTLGDLKESSDERKESVLIIDDLDRIDPDHAFRILNVFAAHFDYRNRQLSNNKFGFDKVIFVCDIDNIRNIFKAKHGPDVDFNGYSDKFYSKKIYFYDNFSAYTDWVKKKLSFVEMIDESGQYAPLRISSFLYQEDLFSILSAFLAYKLIDLRNVDKWEGGKLHYSKTERVNNVVINSDQYPIIIVIKFLVEIKGSVSMLLELLNQLQGKSLSIQDLQLEKLCVNLIILILKIQTGLNGTEPLYYDLKGTKVRLSYGVGNSFNNFTPAQTTVKTTVFAPLGVPDIQKRYEYRDDDLVTLLIEALSILRHVRIL